MIGLTQIVCVFIYTPELDREPNIPSGIVAGEQVTAYKINQFINLIIENDGDEEDMVQNDPWVMVAAIAQGLAAIATFWAVWVALGVRRKQYRITMGMTLSEERPFEILYQYNFINIGQRRIIISDAYLRLNRNEHTLFFEYLDASRLGDELPKIIETEQVVSVSFSSIDLEIFLEPKIKQGIIKRNEVFSVCFVDSVGQKYIKSTNKSIDFILKNHLTIDE